VQSTFKSTYYFINKKIVISTTIEKDQHIKLIDSK